MSNVVLQRVWAEDCFAYKELDFNFLTGIHSITGTNGSSKSSIFCTVAHGLYHSNPKEIMVDDVSNSISGNLYTIKNWFSKGSKEYLVIDSKKLGKMEIFEDGRDISLKRIPDNLKLIEEILECNYAEFIDIFYNCPESTMNLLDAKSDLERKKFINKVLRMSELDYHLDRMKEKEKGLSGKNGTIPTLAMQISTLETSMVLPHEEAEPVLTEHLDKALVDLRVELDALKTEQAIKAQSKEVAEKELKKANAAAEVVTKLSYLEQDLKDLLPQAESEEELQTSLTILNDQKVSVSTETAGCKDKIQRGEKFAGDQKKITEFETVLTGLPEPESDLSVCTEQLLKIRGLKSVKESERTQKTALLDSLESASKKGKCPTCQAEVDKDKFVLEIAAIVLEIATINELITKCTESITKYSGWQTVHQNRSSYITAIDKLKANTDSNIDLEAEKANLVKLQDTASMNTAATTCCSQGLAVIRQRKDLEVSIANLKAEAGEVQDVTEVTAHLQDLVLRLAELFGLLINTTAKAKETEQAIESGRNHNALAAARKELNVKILANNLTLNLQIDAARKELQEAEETLELTKTWVGILGSKGFRVHKIEKFLRSLNSSMRNYSEIISNGSIQCHFFITEDGKVDFTVTDSYKNVSWNCFSAGQKARVKLSCLFAVLELLEVIGSVSFNVFCMDEVFGRMDAEGMEGLFRALEYLKERGKSLYLIAHSELTLPITYDSVIKAEMQSDGTTTITQ